MLEKQIENKRHNKWAKLFGIHMTENICKTYMPNIRAYFLTQTAEIIEKNTNVDRMTGNLTAILGHVKMGNGSHT